MKIVINNEEFVDKRIDKVLPILISDFTRSKIQNLIKEEKILVNNKKIKANYLFKLNDEIVIEEIKPNDKLEPKNIDFKIVYEDDYLYIIDKPRGLTVHPGNGNTTDTLVNALLYKKLKLSNIDTTRPGIVHRIDKDTSGLLIIAKDNKTHLELAKMLKTHDIKRTYLAVVLGKIQEEKGRIIAPISRSSNPLKMEVNIKKGKEAESIFKVLDKNDKASLVEVNLKQGRTHQIRVHFEYIKHPIIGDPIYGKNNCNLIKDGQILHAYKLEFIHPITKQNIKIKIDLPTYFIDALKLYSLSIN